MSATACHSFFSHYRLTRVLASRADLAGGFLDGDEAFAAVYVRPDGVLNRSRDADPLFDLGYVEDVPVFVTRQFGHWIAESRLDFGLGEQFPGAFLAPKQRVYGAAARRVLESAGHVGAGRVVEAHSGFVVLGAVEPVELVLHRRLDALELLPQCVHVNGCVVVVCDVAGGGGQVIEDGGTRADAVLIQGTVLAGLPAGSHTSMRPRLSYPSHKRDRG